jgi:hypothetical protein
MNPSRLLSFTAIPLFLLTLTGLAAPRSVSGIYPHLAMFNDEGECGTGGLVPWADRLWVITYGPHLPRGSSDKLYEITPDLQQIIRPESIGGTPACRMIHPESQQLFLGPYAIDSQRAVRAIPYSSMFGRHTGLARHLADPTGKIVYATMEEGIYEVDVKSLAVRSLWVDEQLQKGGPWKKAVPETVDGPAAGLPGYHGKGFYSGQGRYIYANNGEHGREAQQNPAIPSGVLAEWDGKASQWTIVRRNQFTEVTGPGGLVGSQPTDPVWSIGWDHRSLLLMLLDKGQWHTFRLPKASGSYDGAHGWNTEWPRIREVGDGPLLMTMHGMFWEFPRSFSAAQTDGVRPVSSYLKVIGDFCAWQDHIVFGCDDSAKSEFLNKRKAKGQIAPPQSQSNLWFLKRSALPSLGPTLSQGAVWRNDDIPAGTPSDPYLHNGSLSSAWIRHEGTEPVTITIEWMEKDARQWSPWFCLEVPPGHGTWLPFPPFAWTKDQHGKLQPPPPSHSDPAGTTGPGPGTANALHPSWIRLRPDRPLKSASAVFCSGSHAHRPQQDVSGIFAGLAPHTEPNGLAATVRARGEKKGTLHCLTADGSALYELDAHLNLQHVSDPAALAYHKANCAIPAGVLAEDAASLIYTDDSGRRWRLPRGHASTPDSSVSTSSVRICREVATERDLFNAGGTFYELPAENAGGFARVRPVCTHNRRIHDFCSWRGLLIMTGVEADAPGGDHIIRSPDGKAAVWAGAVDDLWKLPAPTGTGGPWMNSPVEPSTPSDPFLLWGFQNRTLSLSSSLPTDIRVELDPDGLQQWILWKSFSLAPGRTITTSIPPEVQARWLRVSSSQPTTASAQITCR